MGTIPVRVMLAKDSRQAYVVDNGAVTLNVVDLEREWGNQGARIGLGGHFGPRGILGVGFSPGGGMVLSDAGTDLQVWTPYASKLASVDLANQVVRETVPLDGPPRDLAVDMRRGIIVVALRGGRVLLLQRVPGK